MGVAPIILARRDEELLEFNQSRTRAQTYLEKCQPDYITDPVLLGLAPAEEDDLGPPGAEAFDLAESTVGSTTVSDFGGDDDKADAANDPRQRAKEKLRTEQRQLLEAAASGHSWKCRKLARKAHINLDHTDSHGRTAVFLAAERGNPKCVEYLLGCRAKADKKNYQGWTPLAAAVFHGQVTCLNVLMMALADINTEDKFGCTPLILAASSPKLYLVDLVSKRDRRKREKIRRNAFNQQQRLDRRSSIDGLVGGTGSRPDQDETFSPMDPLTIWSYHPNRIELIVMEKLLEKKKVKVDAFDKKRRTALIYASRYGRKYAASRLLAAKANLRIMDSEGKTALHHAACHEHVETVKLLLAAGGNVNSTDQYFRTPLHGALESGDEQMANLLLKAEASVNAYDCEGRFPIMLAMDQGNRRLFSTIVAHKSNPDVLDKRGWNVVIYAIETQMLGEVLPLLLKLGDRSQPILRHRDPQGRNSLHHAVTLAQDTPAFIAVQTLEPIDREASTLGDCNGDTAIHMAAELGRLESLRVLTDKMPSADFINNRGETPLHHAAHRGHMACVVALVQNSSGGGAKCDAGALDGENKSVLMHACVSGHLDLVNLLLQNREGTHPELMLPPLDVNHADVEGATALSIAAREGHWQLLPSLVLAGANIASKDRDGFTAVHWATVEDEPVVLNCLLDLGLDPNATDGKGWTPMMHAASRGSDEALRVLVRRGASLEARNKDGDTAMQICTRRRDAPKAVQVTKDILMDGMLDVGIRGRGAVAAQGHFKVSVLDATEVYLEGKVAEVNAYVCLQMRAEEGAAVQTAFTSCALKDPSPEWHEVFRFDTQRLDPTATLVAWVIAAPGDDVDEILQAAEFGLRADELHEFKIMQQLTHGAAGGGARKKRNFRTAMQETFARLMRRADREEDRAVDRMRNAAIAEKRGSVPTENLRFLEDNQQPRRTLEERRWHEVQNLIAVHRNMGAEVSEPLVPRSHLPIGCVIMSFRHLRAAVWGTEPVEVRRQLALSSRGNLRVEIDFRPVYFVARVEERARQLSTTEEEEIYHVRPLDDSSLIDVFEDVIENTFSETLNRLPLPDPGPEQQLHMVRHLADPEVLFTRFVQITRWSSRVLRARKILGSLDPLSLALAESEESQSNGVVSKVVRRAVHSFRAAREYRSLRQQFLDKPVGTGLQGLPSIAPPGRTATTTSTVQPGRLATDTLVKLPRLDAEPWLEELLDSSRFF